MKELFSLGELYASDFLQPGEEPRHPTVEMKLLMDDNGSARLETIPPFDVMYGKYFYRSGINASMKAELKSIVDSIISVKKLSDGYVWCDIACFTAGNFVSTKLGNIDIKDIRIGDEVLSHDGKYHNIANQQRNDLIQEIDETINHLIETGELQKLYKQGSTKRYGKQ